MSSKLFHRILQQYWGYSSFRPLQEEIIQSVYEGNDTLGLMPTGGGKSLTFQVPALAREGLCLVVTPLIALMKDQVDNLRARGIKAVAIYSGMTHSAIITALENCIFGDYKFLYVSPERLTSEIFLTKLRDMNVNLLAVDESHCISQWGYDFRPAYLNIAEIREKLEGVPVLALTATATKKVAKDIEDKLLFEESNLFRKSFERENLSYVVRYSENKIDDLVNILNSVEGTAIVYVRSRKATREVAQLLVKRGMKADYFHAGLSHEVKTLKQNEWKDNTTRIIVATNAFGMGIDKADVRVVVHLDLPNSLEEYYQEAGRAGRDERRAYAVVLWNRQDIANLKRRISDAFPDKKFIVRVYESLANYYQVALGSGFERVFDFDLKEFSHQFRFPLLQTHHALKLLEYANYIEYTDEVDSGSRLKFLLYRNELYELNLTKEYEEVIQFILRNYTGLFADYVYINEAYIARMLHKTQQEVYELLSNLSKFKYIHYIPQKRTAFVTYTTAREDTPHLFIPNEVYEKRRERLEKRIYSMIHYVEHDLLCRSRVLLHYFDERDAKDCGVCDVCVAKRKGVATATRVDEIEAKVMDALATAGALRLNELLEGMDCNNCSREEIINVIRLLLEQQRLVVEDDKIRLSKKG